MLTFLRKIRRSLIESDSTRKYLFYAIGEIALVVIGILIALQINNLNEARKDETKLLDIFTEIQKDIVGDIEEAREIIPWYEKYDSIAKNILRQKYQASDYQNSELKYIMRDDYPFYISDRGYQLLSDNKDLVSKKYSLLTKDLDFMYNEQTRNINELQDEFRRAIFEFKQHLQDHYEWDRMLGNDTIPQEAVRYFLEDGIYKNKVSRYRSTNNYLKNEVFLYKRMCASFFFRLQYYTASDVKFPDFLRCKVPFSSREISEYQGDYVIEGNDSTLVQRFYVQDGHFFHESDRGFWSRGGFLLCNEGQDTLSYVPPIDFKIAAIRDSTGDVTAFQAFTDVRETFRMIKLEQ